MLSISAQLDSAFRIAIDSAFGIDADPLVTKSYVDKQIASLASKLGSGTSGGTGTVDSSAIAQLQTDIGDLTKFVIDAMEENEALKARIASLESGYTVVEVKAGKKILLSGGTEAILRNGSATAVKGSNGDLMIDATAGVDLKDGTSIPLQHILISSRNDGRGLSVKTNSFLLVRGAYTIK
jgi:hypothetical protein